MSEHADQFEERDEDGENIEKDRPEQQGEASGKDEDERNDALPDE